MSFDRDLRERFVRSASAVEEPPVETVFRGIVAGARRRRRIRRATAAGIIIAVGLGAAILGPRALDALRAADTRPARPHDVGVITTIAGTGTDAIAGDGGPAKDAKIGYPVDIALDAEGNIYILQYFPSWVRKIDRSGTITTVYGESAIGEGDQDDPGFPFSATGLAVDASGNVYVALDDPGANEVIRVNPTGDVTTVAGTGQAGFSGDGGLATEARLRGIWDVAVDAEGNLFISADGRIRRVDTTGVITTIAGTGVKGYSGDGGPAVDARLAGPTGVAVDEAGNVYVLDNGNGRIRRIDEQGVITTIAGPGPSDACVASGDGGAATEADICGPEGLTIDTAGNIYFADTKNGLIRKIDINGIITSVAGTGARAFGGDGGPATAASLSYPSSVAVGPDGTIYITDSENYRIRRVTF